MIALKIKSDPIPLENTSHGVVRVRGTRIPLDTVITAFNFGDTQNTSSQASQP